mmetsp:Transcript_5825/g.8288  ORF Transcript_5825/g.8288 Transcript_5825/m.8288 type:complete len:279 (+) Transcript_5825:541-1377(+)
MEESCGPIVMKEGRDVRYSDVVHPNQHGIFASARNKIGFHLDSLLQSSAMLEIEMSRVEQAAEPVGRQNNHRIHHLELVHYRTCCMLQRVGMEQDERFSAGGIRILLQIVCKRMMRPMLFNPQPLGSTNQVSTESIHVIGKVVLGCCSMIGIVLNIQSNQCLRNTIGYGKPKARSMNCPEELKREETTCVENGTQMPSPRTKLLSSLDNLENFLLDLLFEWCAELVIAHVVGNFPHPLQLLLHSICGVIWMNHFILNGHIVSTKHENRITSWMFESIQ